MEVCDNVVKKVWTFHPGDAASGLHWKVMEEGHQVDGGLLSSGELKGTELKCTTHSGQGVVHSFAIPKDLMA